MVASQLSTPPYTLYVFSEGPPPHNLSPSCTPMARPPLTLLCVYSHGPPHCLTPAGAMGTQPRNIVP